MIEVPAQLAAQHATFSGDAGRRWIAALPELAERLVERWELRPTGPAAHGVVALVLPVTRADGTPAALKLQPVDEESVGEPDALRAWDGDGAVRLLEHDAASGSMLLEALDPTRTLGGVQDDLAALQPLAELLGRLVQAPPPPGMRHLRDIAAGMLERADEALPRLADPDERRLLADCAAAVRELAPEPGERLLHWDLHYDNVLAARPGSGREPWLAIDPKPLVGDPGFDLAPALWNRFPDLVATGDVRHAVVRRFDLMTEVLGLDRQRAAGWCLGRVLQNGLWTVEGGGTTLPTEHRTLGEALLRHRR